MGVELKSPAELELMRQANQIVVEAHRAIARSIRPGVSTAELDALAVEAIGRHAGATSAFLGYYGFPASICVAIDHEVVHGIPSPKRRLREGSIVSVDVGVKYRGFIGDAAVTYPVGVVDEAARRLVATTREALYRAIAVCRPGARLSDIGHAVESCAAPRGYGIVTDYVGHGVGRAMHEEPQVPNYGPPGRGPRLVPGMVLAIEPMINEGTGATRVLDDHWTVVTADGRRSAHFEHSVAITADGPVVLSAGLPDDGAVLENGR